MNTISKMFACLNSFISRFDPFLKIGLIPANLNETGNFEEEIAALNLETNKLCKKFTLQLENFYWYISILRYLFRIYVIDFFQYCTLIDTRKKKTLPLTR